MEEDQELTEEEIQAFEAEETALAIDNRKQFEQNLLASGPWGYSKKGLEAKQAAMTMLSTKTGMYARIPLICKGEECPYTDTCQLLPYDLAPTGEPCPIETAQLEMRAVAYADELDYDNSSFTDRQMLNDLVGFDIMLERCRALMTKEGTPVIDIVTNVTENGDEIIQPAVSKAWEAYERILKKRNETYQLMLMTRKDKKKDGEDTENSLNSILNDVINSEEFSELTKGK